MNDSAIFALLDDASPDASPPARSRLYRDYAGMLACHAAEEWPALLARLQEALAAGLYAVPVLGYELGEQLLGIVRRRRRRRRRWPRCCCSAATSCSRATK
jgi:para-aminobenzoate synthetase/4-amino-4-deoxychorismate lyase